MHHRLCSRASDVGMVDNRWKIGWNKLRQTAHQGAYSDARCYVKHSACQTFKSARYYRREQVVRRAPCERGSCKNFAIFDFQTTNQLIHEWLLLDLIQLKFVRGIRLNDTTAFSLFSRRTNIWRRNEQFFAGRR